MIYFFNEILPFIVMGILFSMLAYVVLLMIEPLWERGESGPLISKNISCPPCKEPKKEKENE